MVSSSLRLLGVAPGHPGPPAMRSPHDGEGGRAGGCTQGALGQLEALRVEAVALLAGHGLQQGLLLLQAAGRLQLVHGGQVEEHALVQVLPRVPLGHGLQLPQRVLEAAQVQQAHGRVVVGLRGQGMGAGLGGGVRAAQGPPAREGARRQQTCHLCPGRLTTAFDGSTLRISVKNLCASAKLF